MAASRDAEHGRCDIICLLLAETWKERLIDGTVIYNSKFEIDFGL